VAEAEGSVIRLRPKFRPCGKIVVSRPRLNQKFDLEAKQDQNQGQKFVAEVYAEAKAEAKILAMRPSQDRNFGLEARLVSDLNIHRIYQVSVV